MIPGRKPGQSDAERIAEMAGFYGFKLAQVSDYPRAFQPGMLGNEPVVVARYRMDAPYPDLEIVLPITPQAATAWQRGDKSVPRTVAREMVEQVTRIKRTLASGGSI